MGPLKMSDEERKNIQDLQHAATKKDFDKKQEMKKGLQKPEKKETTD